MKHIWLLFLFIAMPAFAQVTSLPIQPNATIAVIVSTSASSAAAVPVGATPSWQLEIQNTGSSTAFCAFGGSAVAATTSNYPVMPGIDKVITVDQDRKYSSCITATGTTSIYVTGGVGN